MALYESVEIYNEECFSLYGIDVSHHFLSAMDCSNRSNIYPDYI